ncbi:MAG TPA: di-heme oxidoredictase family protein [Steroidobacteraceae bacterium]|nr:di-heme oxidoredictase family protein [Steroidobacteraceae bacterium]
MRAGAVALALAAASGGGLCAQAQATLGRAAFPDSHDPQTYQPLNPSGQARFDLGHAVLNTQWVPAGTAGAGRRDGLGPLFNADSCDECHNEGARGRGPARDGPAPASIVVELRSRGRGRPDAPAGDPVYGHVLNTSALQGLHPEGTVTIRYRAVSGRYPDGEPYELRAPRYLLANLRYGPLAADTIVEPRIAPQLFGIGLLEAVPLRAILAPSARGPTAGTVAWYRYRGELRLGRFDWQDTAVSVRDQTTQAFAREMGLTSQDLPHDDCTRAEQDCLAQPNGGTPEVSAELLDAVVFFQSELAVPESPRRAGSASGPGRALFAMLGCADCHRPRLPVVLNDARGEAHSGFIAPYTDLRLHDLGPGLADALASGAKVPSRWRTAPLWGLGYRLARERFPTFLHDGRARTVEEAILWHDGEASRARKRFESLSRAERQGLLAWLATL